MYMLVMSSSPGTFPDVQIVGPGFFILSQVIQMYKADGSILL
jgi:hypothetical protein